jgi:hemerythrin superfamily protein
MTMDEQHSKGSMPPDQPLQMLIKDHDFVRHLFNRYLNTQDIAVKKEAGPRILSLLEMHTSLEETVFYPRVHDADPALVDACEHDHQEVRQMIDQLRDMDESDPQCDSMFRQLADAVLRHVQTEEQQLFPKVESAGIDMTELGLQLQAAEASMVSDQARASERRV